MLYNKLITNQYNHEYTFNFNEKSYFVHSIVRLTEYGRQYLGAKKKDAILKEHFKYYDGRLCWTYEFIGNSWNYYTTTATTDEPTEKLIEKILCPADFMYCIREELVRQGVPVPKDDGAVTISAKDCEIQEVVRGWIVFGLSCLVILFFKDWYVKSLLFAIAGIIFGVYRQSYKDAYTCYQYPDDEKIKRMKYNTLYETKEISEDE